MPDTLRIANAKHQDLDAVLTLQQEVVLNLPNPSMLAQDNKDFYASVLDGGGQILLAFVYGRLAGCSILCFPGQDDADNLGWDLQLSPEGRAVVAHLDAAYVAPEYRQRGIARHLGEKNLDFAAFSGCHRALCTSWPGNFHALRNLFSLGFVVRCLTKKYGKLDRFILERPLTAIPALTGETVTIHAGDLAGHGGALSRGFHGIGLEGTPSEFAIIYKRSL